MRRGEWEEGEREANKNGKVVFLPYHTGKKK